MDGVLIDSTPAVARVWTQWAVEHGFDPEEVVHRAHGRPSISTIRDYLPHADHIAENREVERREIEDTQGIVVLPGARELLTTLPPDRWAIVTSCTRPLAHVRIRAAELPVPKLFITSDDVTNGKPAPEPYQTAAAKLGFAAAECIVIEDVPAGIVAGKSAGAKVIALRTTLSELELRRCHPDWVLPNCEAIRVLSTGSAGRLTLTLRTESAVASSKP
jgi:mannitol-1-/sugar-/sorbitol-6-phosphatase